MWIILLGLYHITRQVWYQENSSFSHGFQEMTSMAVDAALWMMVLGWMSLVLSRGTCSSSCARALGTSARTVRARRALAHTAVFSLTTSCSRGAMAPAFRASVLPGNRQTMRSCLV